jgi:mono/diheme cytochrome c family protein
MTLPIGQLLTMKPSIKQTMICAAMLLAGAATASAQGDAKELYMGKCATCHGADGAGKTAMGRKLKVQDAHATVAKMSAEDMIKIVTDGKGQGMAGFGKTFTAEQIKGLVDYYRSLGK